MWPTHIDPVVGYIVMGDMGVAYIPIAYIVIGHVVMAYTVMAYVGVSKTIVMVCKPLYAYHT